MENVYVVFDGENFIIGIYRTLENAKKCALKEIKDVCEFSGFDESEKSEFITQLNHNLYVDEVVYISLETLYD